MQKGGLGRMGRAPDMEEKSLMQSLQQVQRGDPFGTALPLPGRDSLTGVAAQS